MPIWILIGLLQWNFRPGTKYDKEAIKRLEEIQKMDDATKTKLFDIIDTYIRDSKARAAYGT